MGPMLSINSTHLYPALQAAMNDVAFNTTVFTLYNPLYTRFYNVGSHITRQKSSTNLNESRNPNKPEPKNFSGPGKAVGPLCVWPDSYV